MMPANAQHSVNGLPAAVEPHAVESWPAREAFARDGWRLRFTDGFSARANSVSTLRFTGASLETAIAQAERDYRGHGLTPLFQITPATQPRGLEAALRARGYVHRSPTVVMVADAAPLADAGSVLVADAADCDFARLTREGSHSQADGDERLATLARVTASKDFFVAGGEACGASVATGDWAGIYVMRTAPSARRQGHGTRVLRAIAAWAGTQGAARLYLQVDEANAAGRALYARSGFREAYRVLHYAAPEALQ